MGRGTDPYYVAESTTQQKNAKICTSRIAKANVDRGKGAWGGNFWTGLEVLSSGRASPQDHTPRSVSPNEA